MKKCLYLLLLFIFALFGCGETAATKIPTTATNRHTSTNLPGTPTATLLLPTATPQSPMATLDPTLEVVLTLYRQTQEAGEIEAQATAQALQSFEELFKGMCYYQSNLSPDGNWLAQDCLSENKFQVIKKNALTVWTVEYKQIFESVEGAGSISPVYWTKDGGYLYFSRLDCCADNDTMSNGNMLYRMDLKNGQWKMVIDGYFNYYSFSPTSRRLLYILNDQAVTGNPLVVHVMDIISGSETKFDFPAFEQAGVVVWKEDGLQFAMTVKTGNVFDENELFSIVVIDLKEGSSKTIVADNKKALSVVQWSNDDVLTIEKHSYYGQYYDIAEQSYYDLNSQQWITPTPSQ